MAELNSSNPNYNEHLAVLRQKLDVAREESRFGAVLADAYEFWVLLLLDAFQEHSEIAHSEASRRSFVRAALAAIEGICSTARSLLLALCDMGAFELSAGEKSILSEVTPNLSRTGEVEERPYYPPTEARVRHLFHTALRQYYPNYKVDVSCEGWQRFKQAIEKRHGLMHPRCLSDLLVSDADIEHLELALEWFVEELVFTTIATAFAALLKRIEQEFPNKDATDAQIIDWMNSKSELADFQSADKVGEGVKELRELWNNGGLAAESIVFPHARKLARRFVSFWKQPQSKTE